MADLLTLKHIFGLLLLNIILLPVRLASWIFLSVWFNWLRSGNETWGSFESPSSRRFRNCQDKLFVPLLVSLFSIVLLNDASSLNVLLLCPNDLINSKCVSLPINPLDNPDEYLVSDAPQHPVELVSLIIISLIKFQLKLAVVLVYVLSQVHFYLLLREVCIDLLYRQVFIIVNILEKHFLLRLRTICLLFLTPFLFYKF